MFTLEISGPTVAWYGAIVATASAIVLTYNIARDRARLKVRVSPNMKVLPPDTQYGDETYVEVTVTNTGRRPIYVTAVWFEEDKYPGTEKDPRTKLLLAESVNRPPSELTEGKWANFMCLQGQINPSVKFVCVTDSTGREHRRRLPRHVRLAIKQSNRAASDSRGANGKQR